MPATARAVMLLAAASAALIITATSGAWAEGQIRSWTIQSTLTSLSQAVDVVHAYIIQSYARRPLVMIGLAGILMLPFLVAAGLLLYRRRPAASALPVFDDADPAATAIAWLELEGDRRVAIPHGRDFLQIGRNQDNDVCLEDETVHRYHAVIERKRGRGFTITDVGSSDGSGLSVNGARLPSAVLADGDTIEIGRARLRFATAA